MSAALGLSQVSRLDAILDGRDRVAAMYTERLKHVAGVKVPYIDPATTRMSWFVYVIQLEQGIDRARVMEKLMADGVPSRPYFVPIHLQPLYRERFGYKPGDFPVTERIAESTLAIPFFTDMTETQVDYVCERISARVGTA
jgi:perosamine synthetase